MFDSQLSPIHAELTQPLRQLEKHLLSQYAAVNEWFEKQWQLTLPPVYGSVDLRNAGFKLAPIDMNLFPAGFNNLNPQFLYVSVEAAKKIILKMVPEAKRILVIPESHTRNLYYWENVKTLQRILEDGGFDVRFGMISDEITERTEIDLPSGSSIVIQPLLRKDDHLYVDEFCPHAILLNNDLSSGIPAILQGLKHPLIPPAELGWSQRLKSGHFQYYAEVVDEFAKVFSIDPWLVAPLFRQCGELNFMQQDGLDCLIANAEQLFADIKAKYAEYGIKHQPFLIVKADAGTYGMAVMTVRSMDELTSMNRKQRTRMSTIKGGQSVDKVIIQEGVYTFETFGEERAVAEPVVYLWGDTVAGGFYRIHQNRGVDENLNAPGMKFEPLAFNTSCHQPDQNAAPGACQNRFYMYGLVAQLSMLAAAREIKDETNK